MKVGIMGQIYTKVSNNAQGEEVGVLRAYAEEARITHYKAACEYEPGKYDEAAYKASKRTFMTAMAQGWPNLPVTRLYDLWCDNNETVQYNAEYLETEVRYEMDVRNFCDIWHFKDDTGCTATVCYIPLEKDEA